jgi:DNA recombination-dependent growth factor C
MYIVYLFKWIYIQIVNLFHLSFSDHVSAEMDISKALNRLGETAIMREDVGDYGSDDIGAAFQKFSVVTKELSNLMKNLVSFL